MLFLLKLMGKDLPAPVQQESVRLESLQTLLLDFERLLFGYSYKSFVINEKEKVFVLEDSLVLYAGFLTYRERINSKINCEFDATETDALKIEELTYNNIGFSIDTNKLTELCNIKTKKNIFCYYKSFFKCDNRTIDYKTGKLAVERSIADLVDKIMPQLHIKLRNDAWPGVLYNFIVIEISFHASSKKGIGVFYTTTSPNSYVNTKCKNWISKGFTSGTLNGRFYNFEQAFKSYKSTRVQRKEVLENFLTYFVVKKYVKDKNLLINIQDEIFQNVLNNVYLSTERNNYIKPINKWTSEELVYSCVKKICKRNKIIYQHRPFFLVSPKGGQMSYDVFITGLNIAIEYQGKQHFEPVEYFGGQQAFESTKARDELKKKLSMEHGIKLIYVNYWEDISIELLKNKIFGVEPKDK